MASSPGPLKPTSSLSVLNLTTFAHRSALRNSVNPAPTSNLLEPHLRRPPHLTTNHKPLTQTHTRNVRRPTIHTLQLHHLQVRPSRPVPSSLNNPSPPLSQPITSRTPLPYSILASSTQPPLSTPRSPTTLPPTAAQTSHSPVHTTNHEEKTRYGDPLFAITIGLAAAAVRIRREEGEKGRGGGEVVAVGLRYVCLLGCLSSLSFGGERGGC